MLSLKEIMPALTMDFSQNITRVGDHIYINPKKDHTSTFIWMHGLEDIPDSFLSCFNNPDLSPFTDTTKIILLCAPLRPLSKNGGEIMTSWYDIMIPNWKQFWGKKGHQELWGVEQAIESRDFIWSIIKDEPVPKNKIFIGGFSQGCSMALLAGLGYQTSLGGILGNSGFMFPFTQINNETPILLLHGDEDQVIPIEFAKMTYEQLGNFKGYKQFSILKGVEHAMMMDNFNIMREFVNKFK